MKGSLKLKTMLTTLIAALLLMAAAAASAIRCIPERSADNIKQ